MYTSEELKALSDEREKLLEEAGAIHERGKKTTMTDEDKAGFKKAMARAAEIKDLIENDNLLAKAVAEQKASVTPPARANIRGGNAREDEAPGAFGRFLKAVKFAAEGDNSLITREMNKRAAAGGAEIPPSSGGFLVDKPTTDKIVNIALASGILPPKCQSMPVTVGNGLKFPIVDTSSEADASRPFRAYWVEEAGTITESYPKYKQATVDLKTLAILCPATMQLLEDAPFAEAFITAGAGREFGYALDKAIMRGSGAGAPLGILNAPCLVTQDAEAAQLADTILAENIVKMKMRCLPGYSYIALYGLNMLDQLTFLVHPTANTPLWLPAGSSLVNKENETIMGMPAFPFAQCSALGDKGDIVFAAMDQYLLAKKGDVRADTSIHAYWSTAQTSFRFIMRIDGMPLLPKAVTPEICTGTTLSHFVTLAARA